LPRAGYPLKRILVGVYRYRSRLPLRHFDRPQRTPCSDDGRYLRHLLHDDARLPWRASPGVVVQVRRHTPSNVAGPAWTRRGNPSPGFAQAGCRATPRQVTQAVAADVMKRIHDARGAGVRQTQRGVVWVPGGSV